MQDRPRLTIGNTVFFAFRQYGIQVFVALTLIDPMATFGARKVPG